ncbi:MAG: hypothetical protein V3R88_10280, partial [Alphaproteobacteria bacterium]
MAEAAPNLYEVLKDFSENVSPLDFVLVAEHWQLFAMGAWYTLNLVVLSLVIGGVLSIPLAIARAYRRPIFNE